MNLKEKFKEIEAMTDLLSELANKQTESFDVKLETVYKFSAISKIFMSIDDMIEGGEEFEEMVNQLKGHLLLNEKEEKLNE